MNKIESIDLMKYVREQKTVSVPQIQKHFEAPYSQARACVQKLEAGKILKYNGGITYKFVGRVSKSRDTDGENVFGMEDLLPDSDDVRPYHVSAATTLDEYIKARRQTMGSRGQVQIEQKQKQSAKPKQTKKTATKKQQEEQLVVIKQSFNELPKETQNLLQSTVIENPEAYNRMKLYFVMRRKGDNLSSESKEYTTYNQALAFLLKMPDVGFEEFIKYVKTI